MAFLDIGAGFASMGDSIAKTAGAAAMETLRGQLDTDRLKLADELASTREAASDTRKHGFTMEEQGARLAAEQRLRDATAGKYETETTLASEEAARKRAAGDSLAGTSGSSSYADRIGSPGVEGGKMEYNKLGSRAGGPYQIMPDTWTDIRAKNPDLNLPATMPVDDKPETLAMHKAAFDRFTAMNATALQKAGADATPTNLYLAHRLGAAGAEKVLKTADESTPISSLFPSVWTEQNPDLQGKTVGDFKRYAADKMKGVTLGDAGTGKAGDVPPDFARAFPKETMDIREKRAALVPSEARTAQWYMNATPDEQAAFRATAPSYIYAKSREDVAQTNAEAKKQVAQAQRDFKSSLVPSADALDSLAYAYNADRTLPTLGFGGAQGKVAIIERAAQLRKEQGISDADWMSGAAQAKASTGALTKLQQQQAAVEAFSATAEKNGELVKDLIAKGVGPSGVPLIDKWIQNGRRLQGDDDVGKFGAALYNYLTESAKVTSGAMGNTPLSDSARKEVQDFINKADNEKTILGVIDTMALERQNRMSGFSETIDRLKKQVSGRPDAATQTAPGATFSNPNPAPAGGAPGAAPSTVAPAAPLSLPIRDGKIDASQLRGGAVYNTDQGLLRYDAATKRMMPIEAR